MEKYNDEPIIDCNDESYCFHCEQPVRSKNDLTACSNCNDFFVCADCRDETLDSEDVCIHCHAVENSIDDWHAERRGEKDIYGQETDRMVNEFLGEAVFHYVE